MSRTEYPEPEAENLVPSIVLDLVLTFDDMWSLIPYKLDSCTLTKPSRRYPVSVIQYI